MKDKIICRVLTGPTASGKTELSLRLAERHGWEIFCMDSMQIYRGMDIGTAKPTREEQERVPHRMIDICDPRDAFSVAAYREQAEALVRQKTEEGTEVLFVGGTGLYLQAMMHPMGMGSVPADEQLRQELNALAGTPDGKTRLHEMLAAVDPDTAARLPPGDVRRTIRAIEVTRGTGIPCSKQPDRETESPFAWRVAAMKMPREILYDRINRRINRSGSGLNSYDKKIRGPTGFCPNLRLSGRKRLGLAVTGDNYYIFIRRNPIQAHTGRIGRRNRRAEDGDIPDSEGHIFLGYINAAHWYLFYLLLAG